MQSGQNIKHRAEFRQIVCQIVSTNLLEDAEQEAHRREQVVVAHPGRQEQHQATGVRVEEECTFTAETVRYGSHAHGPDEHAEHQGHLCRLAAVVLVAHQVPLVVEDISLGLPKQLLAVHLLLC